MRNMMLVYEGNKERYAKISGHGFKMLAEAMEADLPYKLECPALLICGEKDHAGHNSNTDEPDRVNQLIENFIQTTV